MQASQKKTKQPDIDAFRGGILDWYDRHARQLPWRAPVGVEPNPYHVWLSEIMLQQTTVPTVKSYFEKFISIWPSLNDLALADQEKVLEEWAGLGYYARARNLHKCAQVVADEHAGQFPDKESELLKLPGIGPYTAAAISSIAFDKPAAVMDGNIERIMARVFAVEDPLPNSKPILKSYIELLSKAREDRPGDFAQALMDIGSSICTPKSPKCILCPVRKMCAAQAIGIAEDLPKKLPKKIKPSRVGAVYWIENDTGQILCVRRPEKGLLGGMLALPSTQWGDEIDHLVEAEDTKQFVKHTFTHFHLTLQIFKAKEPGQISGDWFDKEDVKGLPTVFKKAFDLIRNS